MCFATFTQKTVSCWFRLYFWQKSSTVLWEDKEKYSQMCSRCNLALLKFEWRLSHLVRQTRRQTEGSTVQINQSVCLNAAWGSCLVFCFIHRDVKHYWQTKQQHLSDKSGLEVYLLPNKKYWDPFQIKNGWNYSIDNISVSSSSLSSITSNAASSPWRLRRNNKCVVCSS